jgi:hypothetical protein
MGAVVICMVDPEHIVEDITFENLDGQDEFHVPVGVRGVVKNIKGLPCPNFK